MQFNYLDSNRADSLIKIILRFLIILCQRRPRLASESWGSLRSQIVPYFSITHAVRGRIAGPYSKLPQASPIRRLALDLVALLGEDSALSSAVDAVVVETIEEPYWRNISAAAYVLRSECT
jgi:pre-rRNA-processing protein IPI1